MLNFIVQFLLNLTLSFIISIVLSMGIAFIFLNIAHTFEWNYKGDIYWIFNVSIITLILTWIVSFGYFMSIIK